MQTFIDALVKKLDGHLFLEQSHHISPEQNNIICTDSFSAAKLLNKGFAQVSNELEKIQYNKLSSTTFFIVNPIEELTNSFGVVAHKQNDFPFEGVLNNNAIFPNSGRTNNCHSYTVISKGPNDLETLQDQFINLFKINEDEILEIKTTPWERAIPIYNNQRYMSIMKVRSELINDLGTLLFGNYTGGISIREIITNSKEFAAAIKGSRKLSSNRAPLSTTF